jgi:hypothetical protein
MGLPIGSAPDPFTIDDDGLHPKGSDGIHNEWIPFRPVIAASLHHSLQPTYRLQQSARAARPVLFCAAVLLGNFITNVIR